MTSGSTLRILNVKSCDFYLVRQQYLQHGKITSEKKDNVAGLTGAERNCVLGSAQTGRNC